MTDTVRKRLFALSEEQDKSLAELSRAVGKNAAYLQQFIKKKSPKVLPELVRHELARILNVPESELGGSNVTHIATQYKTARIPVIGEVRAGAWLEIDSTYAERDEELAISVPTDANLNGRYGLVVVGDSMNKACAPGSIVDVLNIAESGQEPKDGDIVVVERHNGSLVEVTLKRFKLDKDGTVTLNPESTNPSHLPIPINGSESEYDIFLKAIAIGKYEKF